MVTWVSGPLKSPLYPLELGTPPSPSAVSKRSAKVAFRQRNAERDEGARDRLQNLLTGQIRSFSSAEMFARGTAALANHTDSIVLWGLRVIRCAYFPGIAKFLLPLAWLIEPTQRAPWALKSPSFLAITHRRVPTLSRRYQSRQGPH